MERHEFSITCTEKQLWLIARAVEDWHRFLAGQCEMDNALGCIAPASNVVKVREILDQQVRPYIVPGLGAGASYGWSGGECPSEPQKRAIAMSYGIYRQILHYFALKRVEEGNAPMDWNVYTSPTLRCKEQGPLIHIKELWQ